MLNVLEFKNLKIYNSKIAYPVGAEAKNKGTAIIMPGNSYEENKAIMYDRYIINKMMYTAYFQENRYNMNLFNKKVVLNNTSEMINIFNKIKDDEDNKVIRKFAYNYEQLKDLNAYIDMSVYNSKLFELADSAGIIAKRVATVYDMNILTPVKEALSAYSNILYVVDLNTVDMTDTENFDRENANNVFGLIMYLIRYDFNKFSEMFRDMKIVFRANLMTIVIKPEECDKDSYKLLLTLLKRVKIAKTEPVGITRTVAQDHSKLTNNGAKDDAEMSYNASAEQDEVALKLSSIAKASIIGGINNMDMEAKKSYAFTGQGPTDGSTAKVEGLIEEKVDTLVKEGKLSKDDTPKEIEEKINTSLEKDEVFMTELQLLSANRLANIMSPGNLARNKELARKQAEIDFKGKTINQILSENKSKEIPRKKLNRNDLINKKMANLVMPNVDKFYNEHMYDNDVISIINCFKDKSVPVYILDIKKEDSSDDFNKKDTWTVKFESADRVRHTLVFDMPKIINDSFTYLGGNKKNMYKQEMLLPISKTGPAEVQICTSYNKVFMRRVGDKMSPKIERFRKILPIFPKITVIDGDSTKENMSHITTLEYDELAKHFISLSFKDKFFTFNIENALRISEELEFKIPPADSRLIPVGYTSINGKPTPVIYDTKKEVVVGTKDSLIEYIVNVFNTVDENISKEYYSMSVGKKYMHTNVTMMSQDIPVPLVLFYVEGITRVLDKANINYHFSDTRPQLKEGDRNDKGIIEFSDGYLIYDKYPFANSLLMNGLSSIPTKNYAYADMDSKETYLDIFFTLYNSKRLANAIDNFYDLLLDPVTIEVLEDLKLPTDFVSVFLYANSLLEDNEYTNMIDMHGIRVRGNEVLTSIAYKAISQAYERYRATAGNKSPVKLSIPRDKVIKDFLTLNTVEDYSTLNPVLEAEKVRAISFKGHSGMNMDRAYTVANRSYDKSMLGIISMSTPPTGGVGLVRQLPLDSNILSGRGYVKVADTLDEVNNTNLFSPAELLIHGCSTKDDAQRIAMAAAQSKHILPCKKYNSLLVGNGTDKIMAEIISDDFAFKAKGDGKVIEYNEDTGLMVLKYKNGDTDFVELYPKVAKNGGK